jgi:2-polyprenyl-3-methyl-5-hydroxy-6-metoxy-1,4-benzoquinol methylase
MEYRSYVADSLELNTNSPFFLDHVTRYWWASYRCRGKTVLDCASGKGYGTYILSLNAQEATGVDLNDHSLSMANSVFGFKTGLRYEKQNVLELGKRKKKYDVITAFEVIEHLAPEQTDDFLKSLASALSDDGELLLSTPNHDVVLKSRSSIPSFHINNFKACELKKVLELYFEDVQMIGQYRKRGALYNTVFSMDFFNLRHSLKNFLKPPSKVVEMDDHGLGDEEYHENNCIDPHYFDMPPKEFKFYNFSPSHWRQAGLTVCICKKPRHQK